MDEKRLDGQQILWMTSASSKKTTLCLEKLCPLEYINMEGEDDFEVEFSNEELVQLVQDGEQILDFMEIDPFIVDSNDDESKVVKLSDALKYAEDVLNFMASQGLIFSTLRSC